MKFLPLGFAFGLLSTSTGVLARSPVYFASMTQQDHVPEVSLNTFSTWMAHLMGDSKSHSLFYWKDTHRQEALEGVQALWTNPALKELAFDDPFDTTTTSKKSMMVISGVDHPEDLLPGQTPSLYVKDNDAQDFLNVALDTMTQYADKPNSDKIDSGMAYVDTKVDELIDSFKTNYNSLVDTDLFDAANKVDRAFMVEIEKLRGMMDKDVVVEITGLKQLAQEHGTESTIYKQAQRVVSDLVSNHLSQQTTLIITPWTTKTMDKRAVPEPVEKINAVTDFQLLFWTGVFLVLVTSGVLVFVYQLGSVDSGNVVLTSTALPKQD